MDLHWNVCNAVESCLRSTPQRVPMRSFARLLPSAILLEYLGRVTRGGLLGGGCGGRPDNEREAFRGLKVAALTWSGACMGNVFAETKTSAVWSHILPDVHLEKRGAIAQCLLAHQSASE